MTLNEIIEQLEEIRDNSDGNREVLLGTQKTWPFRCLIYNIVDGRDYSDDDNPSDDAVYILEGDQSYENPYGCKDWWGQR